METINIEEIQDAVLKFVDGRSAADIGYAVALLRAYQTGRAAAEAPLPKKVGRPSGSRTRKAKAEPIADAARTS